MSNQSWTRQSQIYKTMPKQSQGQYLISTISCFIMSCRFGCVRPWPQCPRYVSLWQANLQVNAKSKSDKWMNTISFANSLHALLLHAPETIQNATASGATSRPALLLALLPPQTKLLAAIDDRNPNRKIQLDVSNSNLDKSMTHQN